MTGHLGSAVGLEATASWTTWSNLELGHIGHAVSSAGDVNGDGYDEILAAGRTGPFLYLGSADGLASVAAWAGGSSDISQSVSGAGDVDGDGYSDVIVGSDKTARVYHGSAAGLLEVPAWIAWSRSSPCQAS